MATLSVVPRRRGRHAPSVLARRVALRGLGYLALVLGAALLLLPFAYMVGISFMPDAYVLQTPPIFIPPHPTLDNYAAAWSGNSFGQAFFNSVIVACSATALNVALASKLAFAFARYRFPGRNVLCYGMLATMMVPGLVLIIPQFVLASHLHLTNSRLGLIVVYAAGMAFSVFLLRGFFEELPQELLDAASIDGCGVLGTFVRIALPLARPALAIVFIFEIQASWNDLLKPLIYLQNSSLFTMPRGLKAIIDTFGNGGEHHWEIISAASLIATIPMIVIFAFAQRHIIEGIATTGRKG